MKIVFFSSDNNASSGAFRAQINLIKDLENKGHSVTLVLPCYGDGKKLIKQNNIKARHILSAPWVCSIKKTAYSKFLKIFAAPINAFSSFFIKRFLSKNNFDLAVVNTLWTGAGAKAANDLNVPIVWHMREILQEGQNQTFIKPTQSYALINKSKACIAVSQYVKEYYSNNIDAKKVDIVYDGVDKQKFYNPSKTLFTNKTVHFLMMGTVNESKGQHIALKALNRLSNYDFDVKIVGMCKESYKQELLRLVPHIKDRVTFIPPITKPEEIYKQCDIFLMNSVGEAFGLVTVEAMMSGLVVVASDCGAQKEIILSKDNGYFYKTGDDQHLSEVIQNILEHKNEAILIAKNGQSRATLFDKKNNSDAIEKIYLKTAIKEL